MQQIPSGYRVGNQQGKVKKRELEEQQPRVLIASIVSSQAKWLHKFLDEIDSLEYPADRLTFAFLTGNNDDKTFDILDEFEITHQAPISWDMQHRKKRVWLKGDDVDWGDVHRFVKLSMLRNRLVADSLTDEEYVLMVDSDVVDMPTDLLSSLLAVDADIVAPMVYIEDYELYGNAFFYDSLAFRVGDDGFGHLPPYIPGYDTLPDHLTYINSVGTCYLVNSKVFRAGVKYVGGETLSEQVGFCECAEAAGFRVAVAPDVSVLHCNFELYGERFKP